jgi:hypothetical protein
MTEYVVVFAQGLTLLLTRAEFFRGVGRVGRRLPRGSKVLETHEVVSRNGG